MDEDQKILLEEFFNSAQLLLATDGYVSPLYILLKDKTATPITHDGKITVAEYANVVTEMACDDDMDAAILICEQTMVRSKNDDPGMQPYLNGEKPIREHPNAKHYLMGCFMTAEGKYETMVAEIHTEPSKGTRYVFEPEWMENVATNYLVPWRT